MARLRRLTQLYTAAWSARVSSEITSTQFGVLSSLNAIPGQDQGTLGQSLSMDKSSTADVVGRLSKRGYVRVLRDEADSRRKILMLAPEGLEVLEQLRPRVTALRNGAFADFDQAGRGQFLTDMSRLIETLERAEDAS
nr:MULTISPECIES: MarR family winged helix-turn-helix transcriptional regulator [unclassified Leucobacter]